MLFKLKIDKKLCDIPQKWCINTFIIMIMMITFYPLKVIYFCHNQIWQNIYFGRL